MTNGWCRTCGNPVGGDDRCACWCHVAGALERYLGMDFDAAADLAARLWETKADKEYVWPARYADDHNVETYDPPAELAALQEQDKRSYPHDEDCPRCGRRQWATEDDGGDPDQANCRACGYRAPVHMTAWPVPGGLCGADAWIITGDFDQVTCSRCKALVKTRWRTLAADVAGDGEKAPET